MKKAFLLLSVLLLLGGGLSAQKRMYLRVFDETGAKIAKGYLAGTTTDALILLRGTQRTELPLARLGTLKTKKSLGRNMLIGGFTGVGVGAIAGLISNESGDETDIFYIETGAVMAGGALLGGTLGLSIGALVTALRKNDAYVIDSDPVRWAELRTTLDARVGSK